MPLAKDFNDLMHLHIHFFYDSSVDNLRQFVTDYLDGKIEAYVKSEEIPSDNDGPVKVVVGKNFDEIVNDPEKDVLIEFYAPWCGHCKNLEPKYKELGEKVCTYVGGCLIPQKLYYVRKYLFSSFNGSLKVSIMW